MGLLRGFKKLFGVGAKVGARGGKVGLVLGRLATNKKGMGFMIILLSFIKSVFKASGEALEQKSPLPIIKQVGGEIFATDKTIIQNVDKLKHGGTDGVINSVAVYTDLYTALFTMVVLFIIFYLIGRGLFVGSGNPFLNSALLALFLMFLVEGVYYLFSIVYWGMPAEEFVMPLKGLWVFFSNWQITLPG